MYYNGRLDNLQFQGRPSSSEISGTSCYLDTVFTRIIGTYYSLMEIAEDEQLRLLTIGIRECEGLQIVVTEVEPTSWGYGVKDELLPDYPGLHLWPLA